MGVNHLVDDSQSLFVLEFLTQTGFQLVMGNGGIELSYIHLHAILSVFQIPHGCPFHTFTGVVYAPSGNIGTTPMVRRLHKDRLYHSHNRMVGALVRVEVRDLKFPLLPGQTVLYHAGCVWSQEVQPLKPCGQVRSVVIYMLQYLLNHPSLHLPFGSVNDSLSAILYRHYLFIKIANSFHAFVSYRAFKKDLLTLSLQTNFLPMGKAKQ